MAQNWPAKAPTEIVERRWSVPVDPDDGLSSFARVASGVTIDSYRTEGDDAVLTLSAGVVGTPASVVLTATTSRGRVLVETFYLPIQASAVALGYTVRDVCGFALRKVVGNGNDAESIELDDAVERLSDMLAFWKDQGADVGVPLPIAAGDTLYVPDAFATAIKANLIIELADLYEFAPSPRVITNAQRGLQQVKSALLSKGPREAVYF
jgi:hypothetical protein